MLDAFGRRAAARRAAVAAHRKNEKRVRAGQLSVGDDFLSRARHAYHTFYRNFYSLSLSPSLSLSLSASLSLSESRLRFFPASLSSSSPLSSGS